MNTPVSTSAFATRLFGWFDRHGRHDLPWQHPRQPYRVWLSEIMLQQTQVQTAIPYFLRFVEALPDVPALAAADSGQVMALWSGLGYYARARNLHAAAKLCVERHGGELPDDFDALVALPGIGRSTAGAILAQAFGQRFAILDGNVKRVLARWRGIDGWPGTPAIEKRMWELSESLLPHARLPDYTQALMDLGATLCTRANPACAICPAQEDCVARIESRTHELPTSKPAKANPERECAMVLAFDPQGRVLLQRRDGKGVWNGLWSLPQAEDAQRAAQLLARHARFDPEPAALPRFTHVFSHYKLHITPLRWRNVRPKARLADGDATRWAAPDELPGIGLPAPVRKLLAQLRNRTMSRTVFCSRHRIETEGLDFPPWPGPLGQRVFEEIGKPAWNEWLAHQTMLINENRLSPRDPKTRAFLMAEMEKFLFGGGVEKPAGYVAPETGG